MSEKAVPSLSVLVRVSYLERARAVWTEEQQKPEIHEEMKGHLQLTGNPSPSSEVSPKGLSKKLSHCQYV